MSAQDIYEEPDSDVASVSTFRNTVYANVSYPQVARSAGVSGKVLVTYTVSPAGYILNLEATTLADDQDVPETAEQIVVLGKAVDSPKTEFTNQGAFALQAESLMVLQRIRQLSPDTYNGKPVASTQELVFDYVLK